MVPQVQREQLAKLAQLVLLGPLDQVVVLVLVAHLVREGIVGIKDYQVLMDRKD